MEDYTVFEEDAALLRAIAHPVRLCILKGLVQRECNVLTMQECLGLPQSTVSQHLGVLRSHGIVRASRCGVKVCYSLSSGKAREIIEVLARQDGGLDNG